MPETVRVQCCIPRGGPAGVMLGFLLARAGVEVCILEKHADFFRDFRGDTVHASTLEIMYELGLLEDFLTRPHQDVTQLSGFVGQEEIPIADFTHLPTHCRFVTLMPQWDFLNFLAEHGKAYPGFHLRMENRVTDLLHEDGGISGVRAQTPSGTVEILADLVVAADGRHSIVRERAGLKVIDMGAPMDVLWMRLSRLPNDPGQAFGRADPGQILVLIDRGDYWQAALVIPKGSAEQLRKEGLESLRKKIANAMPLFKDRVQELQDWDKQVQLLTVAVDRLEKWSRPGLLCIGDAAHAMSPIGGVGINLAIQDAVAAANILAPRFRRGTPTDDDLQAVQRRREFPTKATQRVQLAIQNRVISNVLASRGPLPVPWPLRLFRVLPFLRRIPARFIGLGARPEHVRS